MNTEYFESVVAFVRVTSWISDKVPVILETPVASDTIDEEVVAAQRLLVTALQARRLALRRRDKSIVRARNAAIPIIDDAALSSPSGRPAEQSPSLP